MATTMPKSAAIDIAETAIGNGILLAGGVDDIVERNLVYDHDIAGIGVITLPEKVLVTRRQEGAELRCAAKHCARQRHARQPRC